MVISRMPHTLALAIGIGLAAAGCGYERPVSTVSYLGSSSERDDLSYSSLVDALKRTHPDLHARTSWRYVAAPASDEDAIAAAVREELRGRPTLIVAPTGSAAAAAHRAAGETPVVFATLVHPVLLGAVQALHAPGYRRTGVSLHDPLSLKRLELLTQALPAARRVGLLADHWWIEDFAVDDMVRQARQRYAIELVVVAAETPADVDAVMTSAWAPSIDAWYVPASYVAYLAEPALIAHLRRLRKPAIHATTEAVERGALMAYAQDTSFVFDAMADLVARVVDGEDPSKIPVEVPRRHVLAVRYDADAQALGLSPSIVRRADRLVR